MRIALFISHMMLCVVLLLSLSARQFDRERARSIAMAGEIARTAAGPIVTQIAPAITGANYQMAQLPSAEQSYRALTRLLYFEAQGTAPQNQTPFHLRYARDAESSWRAEYPEGYAEGLSVKIERIETALAANPENENKLRFLLDRTRAQLREYLDAALLDATHDALIAAAIPNSFGEALDQENGLLHLVMPVAGLPDAQLRLIFDASQISAQIEDLWREIVQEFIIALLMSGLLIIIGTQYLVQPLSRLAAIMRRPIEDIQIEDIPDQARRDEIGTLARQYASLTTRVQNQLQELRRTQAAAIDARDEALRANEAKNQFLANVSHELRTPMNAILGYSETMRLGVFGEIEPPRYREYVDNIHFSGQLLLKNINDLLDLARIESNKLGWHEEMFSLLDTIHAASRTCRAGNAEAHLLVESSLPAEDVEILGDADRLSQAIINLIGNALKFCPPRTPVRVVVTEEAEMIRIAVIDRGCGIAPEAMQRILQPFGQANADSYSAQKGGLGLGLTITGHVMQRFGGRLEMESEEGVGTTASLLLPRARISYKRETRVA